MPNVGLWVSPTGQDITNITSDIFDIAVGGEGNPGVVSVELQGGYSLASTDQGVYTCIIPDEMGKEQYMHVAIYQDGFSGMLWVYAHNDQILNIYFRTAVT